MSQTNVDILIEKTVEQVEVIVQPNLYIVSVTVSNGGGGSNITKTSDLTNDGEDGINPFITLQDLPIPTTIPTKTSDLTNDGSDGNSTYVETDELGATAFSNDYNDLDNKPTIPTGITNHSGLSLDDGTNPHGTTKSDVDLGNVDNTSDADKNLAIVTLNNKTIDGGTY